MKKVVYSQYAFSHIPLTKKKQPKASTFVTGNIMPASGLVSNTTKMFNVP